MRSVLSLRLPRGAAFWSLLLSAGAVACSSPGPENDGQDIHVSGAGGQGSGLAGTTSAPAAGSGGVASAAAGTGPGASAGVASGGASAGHAGTGGLALGGAGGALAAGSHSGGASGGIAASAGTAGTAGSGGAGTNATCQKVKSEYATELDKQLGCNPNAGSQCTNKVAAAPGCECRVFMQPTDPFAIEHLANLDNGWFEADCSMPSCPAKCSTAAVGTCQADAKSPLGGRCVTP